MLNIYKSIYPADLFALDKKSINPKPTNQVSYPPKFRWIGWIMDFFAQLVERLKKKKKIDYHLPITIACQSQLNSNATELLQS